MYKDTIVFPEECKKYFELQCNSDLSLYTDMPEIKNIDKYIKNLNPISVMDIGSGIGRASVYLHHRYSWNNSKFYLLDGDGGDVQLASIRSGTNEFYNSFAHAKVFCEKNGLRIKQLNANNNWVKEIGEPVELIYSFLAIGFHWPIDFYLKDLYKISKKDAFIIFGIRGTEQKQWVDDQISAIDRTSYEIVEIVHHETKKRDSVLVLKNIHKK